MYAVSISSSSVANYCMLSSCILFITVNNVSSNGGQTNYCCHLPGCWLTQMGTFNGQWVMVDLP